MSTDIEYRHPGTADAGVIAKGVSQANGSLWAMRRFVTPEGWVMQAFDFALDLTSEQAGVLARQFGGRRYAYNWAVRTLKDDIEAFRAGQADPEARPPSLIGLRKRWNQAKDSLCVDADSGEVWWPAVSKEAFADGIKGAVDGWWRWQNSRAGTLAGPRSGTAPAAGRIITATITPRSTLPATPPPGGGRGPWDQSGPPKSAEPTVRQSPALLAALKR